MENKKPVPLKMLVFSALFAGCIAIGSYIAIPFGPVPFVLSNFFVLLAALLLGSKWGAVSVSIYLLCGLIGLPVFSQGGAGLAHIIGPKGGYLFGFLAAAWTGGFISEKGTYSMVKSGIALVIASLIVYALGVPWLKIQTDMTWNKAVAAGMLPFLLPDALKVAAAVGLQKALLPVWNHFIRSQNNDNRNESKPEIS